LKVHEQGLFNGSKGIMLEHYVIGPTVSMVENIEFPGIVQLILQQAIYQIVVAISLIKIKMKKGLLP